MYTYVKKWMYRMGLLLLITLFSMPLGVSAATQQLDISKSSQITVLKGKSYKLVLSNIESLAKKAAASVEAGSAETGTQTAAAGTITWTSSKKSVVSVKKKTGKITAKKAGTAVITAKMGDFQYTCQITVNKPVTKVKLNKSSKTIKCGKTYTLKATVKPTKRADTTLKWSSSDKKIAKVNSKGKVTAVGIGSCTITAQATDGSGKKATCKIKVKAGTMTLSETELTLSKGAIGMLQVKNVDTAGITWVSSNKKVATVTSDGEVTGVKKGTAVISACMPDGSQTVYCTVTVVNVQTAAEPSERASQFLAILQKYSSRVENDYKSGTPWTYSNSGTSVKWSTARSRNHKVNCALMVRWGLREMGIINSANFWGISGGGIEFKSDVKLQLLKYCDIIRVYKTPNQLLAEGNLLPGDICTWKEVQHTNVYAGGGLWYDAGRGVNYTSAGTFSTLGPSASMSMSKKTVGYIIRLK